MGHTPYPDRLRALRQITRHACPKVTGDGTRENPYEIEMPPGLQKFSEAMRTLSESVRRAASATRGDFTRRT